MYLVAPFPDERLRAGCWGRHLRLIEARRILGDGEHPLGLAADHRELGLPPPVPRARRPPVKLHDGQRRGLLPALVPPHAGDRHAPGAVCRQLLLHLGERAHVVPVAGKVALKALAAQPLVRTVGPKIEVKYAPLFPPLLAKQAQRCFLLCDAVGQTLRLCPEEGIEPPLNQPPPQKVGHLVENTPEKARPSELVDPDPFRLRDASQVVVIIIIVPVLAPLPSPSAVCVSARRNMPTLRGSIGVNTFTDV
mmetsp:Transcript_14113/g.36040  ORF Transcript_14113/g.36040 Transcript_14113/m.36040 type:complete len:250 (-) Transcript_14113:871-1620(-)